MPTATQWAIYHDQVGSTILSTAISNVVGSRGYYAFGATRRSSGLTPTDRRFTGQVEDPTGLCYDNSRYYDPQLGQFLSPDTIVPEPNNLLTYNRYLYAKGNPLKYSDPTGHYSVEELQQHFGVNSFDELMALFGEGGQYEGLEGWYDVLRAAQDGDTVTATNDLAGSSLTGTCMRSAQGEIQIDMGEQGGTAPESLFAHFGGVIVRGEPKVAHYVAGIGTYELREQSYAWRRAIVGGQRQRDMSSCYNVDCVAATFDMIGMVGSGIQIASPLCTGFVAPCTGTKVHCPYLCCCDLLYGERPQYQTKLSFYAPLSPGDFSGGFANRVFDHVDPDT